MVMLAIDTSGADCAVGIFDMAAGRLEASVSETIGKGHAERLMSMVDEALAEAGHVITDITRIAVTVGPGSFTGIRVGVAAARGFALALNCPAISVSTLEVIARAAIEANPGDSVLAAMDAKRDEVYAQVFSAKGLALGDPIAISPDDAVLLARRYGALVAGSGRLPMLGDVCGPDRFPLQLMCSIASQSERGEKPTPLYIRGADARPQTGFAVARS